MPRHVGPDRSAFATVVLDHPPTADETKDIYERLERQIRYTFSIRRDMKKDLWSMRTDIGFVVGLEYYNP